MAKAMMPMPKAASTSPRGQLQREREGRYPDDERLRRVDRWNAGR
jgi:hypothetical protein